jgi:hypothetical protein
MKRRKQSNRPPRRVDAINNYADHWCLLLAMRGRSNRAIIKKTGLTPSQISYRLKTFGVSRMDYRNGEGPLARKVDKATEELAEAALLRHLEAHVGREELYGEPIVLGGRH